MYLEGTLDGENRVSRGNTGNLILKLLKTNSRRGGKVIILCRNTDKGQDAIKRIKLETGYTAELYKLDLASLDSVRECAAILKKKYPKIDILLNNAGVMLSPKMETKDGFELQLGTNHFGHFLFTLLLLDNVKAASPSRIINVSSLAHTEGKMFWDDLHMKYIYTPMKAYQQSKLANILFTKSLAEKLKGSGVTTYALHPGVVATELGRHLPTVWGTFTSKLFTFIGFFFFKSPKLGAQTSIYCAVDESLAKETGKYYSGCNEKTPSKAARNMEDAERLWKISLKTVGLQS
ncbi:UNVERIFIED_CONTAM: hypothetical protein GTU68_027662, partial [Idotea baltica]|nr:hypothetical protein [Idotea baltica]MCL4132524.1 hypothetical protein [Idotea baltica]